MDWLNAFYLLAGLVTIISLIYAVVAARRSDRRKMLLCDITPSLSLATILPDQSEHRLSIVYEREGGDPINVKGAYLYFVKVANLGKEPIRREDIVASDPLRIEIKNATVLDIANSSISRDVINFGLTPFSEDLNGVTVSQISFDFLDNQDGALVRVLADSSSASITVMGTIIGMPEGLHRMSELGDRSPFQTLKEILVILIGVIPLAISATIGISLLSRVGLGTYILIVLLGGIPSIAYVLFVSFYVLSPERRWPKTLKLPIWFRSQYERSKRSPK